MMIKNKMIFNNRKSNKIKEIFNFFLIIKLICLKITLFLSWRMQLQVIN